MALGGDLAWFSDWIDQQLWEISTNFSCEAFYYHFDPRSVVEMGLEMEDIDLVSWTDIHISLQWLHCSCAAQGNRIGKRYHL